MDSAPTERDRCEYSRPAHEESLVATVTEQSDDVALCSLSPIHRCDHVIESEWIAARGDSFVALDQMR